MLDIAYFRSRYDASFVGRSVHLVRFVLVFLGYERCVVLYMGLLWFFGKKNLTALWFSRVIRIFFVEVLLLSHCYCSVSVVDTNTSYCYDLRNFVHITDAFVTAVSSTATESYMKSTHFQWVA
jgi:hypothetical protein